MRSNTVGRGKCTVPGPAASARRRLDRVATASCEQLKTALIVLCDFSPDAFDYAMDAAESEEGSPACGKEGAPACATCGGSIGVFLGLGLDWQHFDGDGTSAGKQQVYDPGHVPVVTWKLTEGLHS